ncbi:MAG: SCO family protein [Salinibacter sp.]
MTRLEAGPQRRRPLAVRLLVLLVGLAALWGPATARAQRSGQQREKLKGVNVTQKLGTPLPLDLTFQNEAGEPVSLGRYFEDSTPVLLTLNYHRCPQLCRIQLRKFAETVSTMDWTPGQKFEILTVDINPDEGPKVARKAQQRYRSALDNPDQAVEGWHFLTGSADAIDTLTDSVGFHYRRLEDRKQQFAHPAALVFVSGSGKITRYFTTLSPAPGDVRTALVEASNGEIGSITDRVFLACCKFVPGTNSYSASAFKIMKYGSILVAGLMAAALFIFWRREKRRQDKAAEGIGIARS